MSDGEKDASESVKALLVACHRLQMCAANLALLFLQRKDTVTKMYTAVRHMFLDGFDFIMLPRLVLMSPADCANFLYSRKKNKLSNADKMNRFNVHFPHIFIALNSHTTELTTLLGLEYAQVMIRYLHNAQNKRAEQAIARESSLILSSPAASPQSSAQMIHQAVQPHAKERFSVDNRVGEETQPRNGKSTQSSNHCQRLK
jgi:hypothetical protein